MLVVAAIGVASTACGEDEPVAGPPVGTPVLPDLVPDPPTVLHTERDASGSWSMRFTSTLVNVGKGDFVLLGERTGDRWIVEQQIPYSQSGSEVSPTDATMVWGGDGHNHWHVSRVANYRLEPIDPDGHPVPGAEGRPDSKIGFCFFDSHHVLERGPEEAQFKREGCGKEDAEEFEMGLTPGWADVYDFALPGQSIDISDLPDGHYRLWAEADEHGWFQEATRDNNRTWTDLELTTRADGARFATVTGTGPQAK